MSEEKDMINKGKQYIYPEMYEAWGKFTSEENSADYVYSVVSLMELLEKGASMKEVQDEINKQGHTNNSKYIVAEIILNFAKRGPEFYESTVLSDELSENDKKIIKGKIENKKKENARFERMQERREEKAEAVARIPEWIKRGEEIISPDRIEGWKEYIESNARGFLGGVSLDTEIDLIERLNKGESFESIAESIEPGDANVFYKGRYERVKVF